MLELLIADGFIYSILLLVLLAFVFVVVKNKRWRNLIKFLCLILVLCCTYSFYYFGSLHGIYRGKFKYENVNYFIFDSSLLESYKLLPVSNHPTIKRMLAGRVYLYSWQTRDSTTKEFTVIEDNGETGMTIYYFILDKSDNIISHQRLAGIGREGTYLFETSTKIYNKDTMLGQSSTTEWWDLSQNQKLEPTKGDTLFFYSIINSDNHFVEVNYLETKTLDK